MEETIEPMRGWIEKCIRELNTALLCSEKSAIAHQWQMDLAVYRMALRTLDAEAHAIRRAGRERDEARAKLAEVERERDQEHRERMSDVNIAAVRYSMIREEAKNCHRLIAVASFCELLRFDAWLRVEHDLAENRATRADEAGFYGRLAAKRIQERDEALAKLRETTQERDAEADCCTEMRKRAKDAERRLAAITPSDDVMSGLRDAVRAYPPTSERHVQRTEIGQWMARVTRDALERAIVLRMPDVSHPEPSPERIDCEASALLLLSTWAKRVMTRPKNRAKGVPTQSILELLRMAWHELSEARWAIADDAPTDDILAELGDAATCIAFAMREIESRRNR